MPFGFALPKCFSSKPRPRQTTSLTILGNHLESSRAELEELQEAKKALRQAKMAHNQMVLDLIAKGFSAQYISNKSSYEWSATISVLQSLYSSWTIGMACRELYIDS